MFSKEVWEDGSIKVGRIRYVPLSDWMEQRHKVAELESENAKLKENWEAMISKYLVPSPEEVEYKFVWDGPTLRITRADIEDVKAVIHPNFIFDGGNDEG